MNSAFATFQGVGADAKIKTTDIEKKVGIPEWKQDWSNRLTGDHDPKHREKYDKLINLIANDLALPSASVESPR